MRLAKRILVNPEAYYPAIHLAVDVQGWKPDDDFSGKLHCKSKKRSQHNAMDGMWSSTCRKYPVSTTTVNPTPLVVPMPYNWRVYNKTVQARKIDKFDYIENKWQTSTQLDDDTFGYDPERDVFRIEDPFPSLSDSTVCTGKL